MVQVFDIGAIWKTLVAQRNIFFVTLIIAALLSTLYLFFAAPVYRAYVQFAPTTEKDVQKVRVGCCLKL